MNWLIETSLVNSTASAIAFHNGNKNGKTTTDDYIDTEKLQLPELKKYEYFYRSKNI